MDRKEEKPRNTDVRADAGKWAAVVACDPDQDGKFWYGVTSTRIFCRPSCPSRTPRRENVRYFASPDEAMRAGFRPCKRCRPNQPAHDPVQALADQVLSILTDAHGASPDQCELAARLDTSPETLRRAFKTATGETISTRMTRLRVDKARSLLAGTALSIPEVALEAGFESLSNFYRCFTAHAGTTPARYRAAVCQGRAEARDGTENETREDPA